MLHLFPKNQNCIILILFFFAFFKPHMKCTAQFEERLSSFQGKCRGRRQKQQNTVAMCLASKELQTQLFLKAAVVAAILDLDFADVAEKYTSIKGVDDDEVVNVPTDRDYNHLKRPGDQGPASSSSSEYQYFSLNLFQKSLVWSPFKLKFCGAILRTKKRKSGRNELFTIFSNRGVCQWFWELGTAFATWYI